MYCVVNLIGPKQATKLRLPSLGPGKVRVREKVRTIVVEKERVRDQKGDASIVAGVITQVTAQMEHLQKPSINHMSMHPK